MKISLTFLLILSLLLPLTLTAQTERGAGVKSKDSSLQSPEKRLALVIGNSGYINAGPLANPANDAIDMAAALKSLGFEVISGTNLTLPQMRKLIREFGTKLQEQKGVGLFYYAGHGIQFNGKNFLIPVDAQIESEVETEDAGVDLNTVLRQMDSANNGFNMIILDACRNNPFARSWRGYRDAGNSGGLARIEAPTGTMIAYATKPGETASDGTGRNGLYTASLLKQMRVKNVEMGKMFQRIRADVVAQSKGKQVPFDESSVIGDFYFAGLEAAAPAVKDTALNFGTTAVDAKSVELEAYRSIQNTNDIADIRAVLEEYPNSEYADAAKLKLESLVWNAVKTSRDKVKLQKYLDEFPNGGNAPLARIELRKLNAVTITGRSENAPANASVAKTSQSPVAVWNSLKDSARSLLKYDLVNSFSEDGLARVKIGDDKSGKWGYIDKLGREVIALKYDVAGTFAEGLAAMRIGDDKTGKWGYIDKLGQEVIAPKYDVAYLFSEGLAPVRIGDDKNGKWGYIDKVGHEVITPKYDEAGIFGEGLAPVRIGNYEKGKRGFIDNVGREVIPFKYNNAGIFAEGLAPIRIGNNQKGKWGFIDKFGREAIAPKYDGVYPFFDGLAQVRIGDDKTGKRGYIDKSGREVITPKYDGTGSFVEGFALVRIGDDKTGKIGLIDKTGHEVVAIKYDKVWCYAFRKEGIYGVILNGKKGFVDIDGNEYFDF